MAPTLSVTAAGAEALFCRLRLPEPLKPPRLKAPLTLWSNTTEPAVGAWSVLNCKAFALERSSVPPLIVVVPANVLSPRRVTIPDPDFASPPPPLITPETVVLPGPPIVSKYPESATGPLTVRALLELLLQDCAAWTIICDEIVQRLAPSCRTHIAGW